jgi:hypothetical protein
MTVMLMMLMSSQVIEGIHHEFCGISMFVLFVIHQVLNRNWYASLLKGRYNLNRALMTVINIALLVSFMLTVFSGIIMSESLPELNIDALASFSRLAHLSCSYLSFVLMGMHLGFHWGMIASRIKATWPAVIAILFSCYGLYVFIESDIMSYITLTNQFAFIDYDKNICLVFLDNFAMLSFWTSIGYYVSKLIRSI